MTSVKILKARMTLYAADKAGLSKNFQGLRYGAGVNIVQNGNYYPGRILLVKNSSMFIKCQDSEVVLLHLIEDGTFVIEDRKMLIFNGSKEIGFAEIESHINFA